MALVLDNPRVVHSKYRYAMGWLFSFLWSFSTAVTVNCRPYGVRRYLEHVYGASRRKFLPFNSRRLLLAAQTVGIRAIGVETVDTMEWTSLFVRAAPVPYVVLDSQRHAMAVTERVVSVFSIIAILFIVSTYLFYPGFDRPINRLVFFTAIGNFGLNFAGLISEAGPLSGERSSLCQFQGFMVQMFLAVDAYWSLCMALNVYLVFFRRYNVLKLKRMDIIYLIVCYGLSFAVALTLLLARRGEQTRIYGDAILWCWVSIEWAVLRIALVYSISWLSIALALIVYFQAGIAVWKRRDELHGSLMNPFNQSPLKQHTVTTEIHVTTEARRPSQSSANPEGESTDFGGFDNYSVTVDVGPQDYRHKIGIFEMRSLTRTAAAAENNTEALLYARAAFFYFVVLLVTWIPSSVNRAYSVTHRGEVNFPLNYLSSLLLPAQGLCNCIVYIVTSRPAVVLLYEDISLKLRGKMSRKGDRNLTKMVPQRNPRYPLDSSDSFTKV